MPLWSTLKAGGSSIIDVITIGFPMYYGSEFCGRLVDLWAYANGVVMEFSRPGKPTDNAWIESFNGTLRDACLNLH